MAKMNGWTAGPWHSQPTAGHDVHGQTAVYAETDGKDVAIVYDGEANAQLVAAAPELAAALLEYVQRHEQSSAQEPIGCPEYDAAIGALRKAGAL